MIKLPTIRTSLSGRILLFAVMCVLFAVTRMAWISDDAYITLRTIDNLIHGYGPNYNAGERVQAYTHPLWFLLLSAVYAITHEPFFTTIILSLTLTFAALLSLAFFRKTNPLTTILLLLLAASSSFVDYATSGLENPLGYLLIALYSVFFLHTGTSIALLTFIAGLLFLNRPDHILLVLPSYVLFLVERLDFRDRKSLVRTIARLTLALAPVFIWHLFSIFYYGNFMPNTALAKLHTGIELKILLIKGYEYITDSLRWDIAGAGILGATLLGSIFFSQRRTFALTLGVLLYFAYIARIGGDFMLGRFLAVPIFFCAFILVDCFDALNGFKRTLLGAISLVLLALSLSSGTASFLQSPFDAIGPAQTVGATQRAEDERRFYYPWLGLLNNLGNVAQREEFSNLIKGRALKIRGRAVIVEGAIGVVGYYAGPAVHIIDMNALADPLLARLPIQSSFNYVPGHYRRPLPLGYRTTIESGKNVIQPGELRKLFRIIHQVTHADLFSPARLHAIWKLQNGQTDQLAAQFAKRTVMPYDQISKQLPADTAWDAAGTIQLGYRGLEIPLQETSHASAFTLTVKNDGGYQVIFTRQGLPCGTLLIPQIQIQPATTMVTTDQSIPPAISKQGFDAIFIVPPLPVYPEFEWSIGSIRLHH
jgi:arabinofuranosyltransferase